jgi:hypothetical protein
VSSTRRPLESRINIFIVAARHGGHEADAIAERATSDILVGCGVGACQSGPRTIKDVLVDYGSRSRATRAESDFLVGYESS